ncbi:MAG: PQQ-binding-like beta-propeller repeat protein [Vulcanimicrobiota bacterium]
MPSSLYNLSTFRTSPDTININDAHKILDSRNEFKAEKVWEFETGGEVYSSPCIDSSGTVYVASGATIFAIKDGKEVWKCRPSSWLIMSNPRIDS